METHASQLRSLLDLAMSSLPACLEEVSDAQSIPPPLMALSMDNMSFRSSRSAARPCPVERCRPFRACSGPVAASQYQGGDGLLADQHQCWHDVRIRRIDDGVNGR